MRRSRAAGPVAVDDVSHGCAIMEAPASPSVGVGEDPLFGDGDAEGLPCGEGEPLGGDDWTAQESLINEM